jgi:hypothetical protein
MSKPSYRADLTGITKSTDGTEEMRRIASVPEKGHHLYRKKVPDTAPFPVQSILA